MPVFGVCALAAFALIAACAWPAGALARGTGGDLQIRVLSNRADLISGGEALVEVGLPSGVRPAAVRVKLGDANVTGTSRSARMAATRASSAVCAWAETS
jgi:hypothetical protein